MRIVAGRFRGRRLRAPEGRDIRPTSDKVRGAVFNMLHSRGGVEEAIVLDVFCGTGALGLEALSRGAARAAFLDKERAALDLAKENAQSLSAAEDCLFFLKDALKAGPRPASLAPATLAFLDPPYGQNFLGPALATLSAKGWLAADALCVAETEKIYSFAAPDFEVLDERLYGDTKIHFLCYRPFAPH